MGPRPVATILATTLALLTGGAVPAQASKQIIEYPVPTASSGPLGIVSGTARSLCSAA